MIAQRCFEDKKHGGGEGRELVGKAGRHGIRDYLLILAMFRRGLRVSEAISLLWIRRLKNGLAVEHPIAGDELRAIKCYLVTRRDSLPWLFVSEREQPFSRQSANFSSPPLDAPNWRPSIRTCCAIHAGFYLANRGYDLRLIQVTSGTAIRNTPSITPGSPVIVPKASGDEAGPQMPAPDFCVRRGANAIAERP